VTSFTACTREAAAGHDHVLDLPLALSSTGLRTPRWRSNEHAERKEGPFCSRKRPDHELLGRALVPDLISRIFCKPILAT
jgi:hypothetical protein